MAEIKYKQWYTITEASEYLSVSRATLYTYMKDGRLPFFYLAGTRSRRVKAEDLDTLLEPGNPDDEGSNEESEDV